MIFASFLSFRPLQPLLLKLCIVSRARRVVVVLKLFPFNRRSVLTLLIVGRLTGTLVWLCLRLQIQFPSGNQYANSGDAFLAVFGDLDLICYMW